MKLMTDAEIAKALQCQDSTVYRWRMRIRGISPRVAAQLEAVTGIPRLAWLYPDEIANPYMPARTTSDQVVNG